MDADRIDVERELVRRDAMFLAQVRRDVVEPFTYGSAPAGRARGHTRTQLPMPLITEARVEVVEPDPVRVVIANLARERYSLEYRC